MIGPTSPESIDAGQPSSASPLSVIVAARDFAGLPTFSAAWLEQLRRIGNPFEVIVSGSELRNEIPGVRAISSDSPHGLGPALRAGFAAVSHQLVLVIVPEFAFRPHDVRALLKAIDTADVVVGVRPGQARSAWQDRLGRLFSLVSRIVIGIEPSPPPAWFGWARWRQRLRWRLIFGLRLQDPESGLLLIRRELLDRCPIQSAGRFAMVEVLAKANFAGAMMAEMPLAKGGELPVMAKPFDMRAGDERQVFRRPKFSDNPLRTRGDGHGPDASDPCPPNSSQVGPATTAPDG